MVLKTMTRMMTIKITIRVAKISRRYVSTFVLRSGTGIPAVALMSVPNKLVQNPLSVGRSMIKSMLFFHCYEHQ